ncbi:MAG TPA: hypothetical protein VH008_21505 [Pseudonocardia sp.]|nr:hypothetical protein [Pseudonocardia sp.]
MQPTGMTSAAASPLASAPAVVELAEASRWRAPEVTAVLAEHGAQIARGNGDLRTALLAEGWLAQGLGSLGHGVAAVPRAVNALSEATREKQGVASDRLRIALAGVARSLDDRSTGLVLLAPVLEAGGASPRLHADAHLEAVLCRDAGADGAGASVDVALAALRQVGGEYGELGLAAADAALAGQLRARRQLGEAVEYARSGLRRMFGDQPAGGPMQPVSPYLAATLGLELTLALLDQGQQDAALESARLVMRWDVQPGSLVPTSRLQLALAQRVYLPAGARDEASASVEWVARAVAGRELPEIEVECHGLLGELRERGGELSEALAASRRGHTAYRALASAVERAVVLLVRAAGEAPSADRRDPDGQRAEAGPRALVDQDAPPVPTVGHDSATGAAAARADSGLANGTEPPWMTSAGPAWRPSVDTARHPGSVTPRGPGADSLTGAAAGGTGQGETNNVYRLFEGGAARSGETASSEPRAPRGPSDPPLAGAPADPPAPTGVTSLPDRAARSDAATPAGASMPAGSEGVPLLGQPHAYDLRASLETTDPLLGRTMAAELNSAGRGGPLDYGAAAAPNGAAGYGTRSNPPDPLSGPGVSTAGSALDGPGPATSPDLLGGTGPLARFDQYSGSSSSFGPSGGADPLSGPGPLDGGPLGGSDPWGGSVAFGGPELPSGPDPLGGGDRRSEPDPLSGGAPLSGYDPLSGPDALFGSGGLSGYGGSSVSDALSGANPLAGPGPDPLSGPGPLSGSDPLGGAGPTAALGAVPKTGWQAAAERLTKPGRSIGGGSLGGPVVPVGLSIAQLAVELLGMNTGTGQPPHLVLIDIATPDGSASGPEVVALTGRIASRVREQLPPAARLYLVERDAVAVALPEVDPEAVTRWVRTVSNGLSLRWSELAAELPRAVFRIDVRALDQGRTIAEQLWDLRIGQGGDGAPGGPGPSWGGQPPLDEQPLPTGRHLAGTVDPAPRGVDPEPNRINAQPGSGGRRRRPDAGGGSTPGGGKAIGQLGLRREDTPSAGPTGGRLTSRHRDSSSVIPTGRADGSRDAGGPAPGAPPGTSVNGHGPLTGTPIARLVTSADQPAGADAAESPEPGRIALAESPRPDDYDFVDHDLVDLGAILLARFTAEGTTANGSAPHGVNGHGQTVNGIAANGSATHGTTTWSAANGTVNGAAVNGSATNGSATNGSRNGASVNGSVNGAGTNGAAASGVNGGTLINGAVNGTASYRSATGSTTNGAATSGSANGASNGSASNGSASNGSARNGTVNGAATNGFGSHGVINGAGARSAINGAESSGVVESRFSSPGVADGASNGSAVNPAAASELADRGPANGAGNGTAVNGTSNEAAVNGHSTRSVTNGAPHHRAASATTSGPGGHGVAADAGSHPETASGGADSTAGPMDAVEQGAEPDADSVDGDEAEQSGRSRRRNGRPGAPRGSAPNASTPVSELSFAELLAGALAAYRES